MRAERHLNFLFCLHDAWFINVKSKAQYCKAWKGFGFYGKIPLLFPVNFTFSLVLSLIRVCQDMGVWWIRSKQTCNAILKRKDRNRLGSDAWKSRWTRFANTLLKSVLWQLKLLKTALIIMTNVSSPTLSVHLSDFSKHRWRHFDLARDLSC